MLHLNPLDVRILDAERDQLAYRCHLALCLLKKAREENIAHVELFRSIVHTSRPQLFGVIRRKDLSDLTPTMEKLLLIGEGSEKCKRALTTHTGKMHLGHKDHTYIVSPGALYSSGTTVWTSDGTGTG